MKKDLKRLSIRSHHYELSNTPVQGLSSFVSALFELLEVESLLNQVEDCDCELAIGQRVSFWVHCFSGHCVEDYCEQGGG